VTPRQRDLLVALLRAVQNRRPALDGSPRARAADMARLLAALAEVDADRAADPVAPVIVDQLLAAWAAVTSAAAPQQVIEAVTAGDPVAASTAWREPAGPPADSATETALTAAARLGEPAGAVLAALEFRTGAVDREAFTSPVAGILLVWRALLDIRLGGLAEFHRYPPAGPRHLLAEVGLRWAGTGGVDGGVLDPAVRLLSGEGPATTSELAEAWLAVNPGAHDAWRTVIDDLATRHRSVPVAPAADALDHTADVVLRIWARWLRGFEQSSQGFLLDQFVRRPGTIAEAPGRVTVRLPRRPLDAVLEMSGYLRPIDPVPGLASRRVVFVVGELR
jgi:hypothetical protein